MRLNFRLSRWMQVCIGLVIVLVCMVNILILEQQKQRQEVKFLLERLDDQAKQEEESEDYGQELKENNPIGVRAFWRSRGQLQNEVNDNQQQRHLKEQKHQHNVKGTGARRGQKFRNGGMKMGNNESEEEKPPLEGHAHTTLKKRIQRDYNQIQKLKNLDESLVRDSHPRFGMTMVERPTHDLAKPEFPEDPMAVLNYAPTRIPGYINTGNNTLSLFGHVMRELTQRICARQIAQSNILVVSPEAPQVVEMLQQKNTLNDDEGSLRRKINHAVGGSTLIHAHNQGHTYHGLKNHTIVDDWWRSFDQNNPKAKPGWILLGMWDHGWQNDKIMQQSLTLLKQSTVTYIVLGFGANPDGEKYGRGAIQHLIDLKYKVQMLSVSHLPSTVGGKAMGLKPNADITKKTIKTLFQGIRTLASATGTPVLGYVFATQGLDLAIPTATHYDPKITTSTGIQYKPCEPTLLKVQFGDASSEPRGSFRHKTHKQQPKQALTTQQTEDDVAITCQKRPLDPSQSADIWHSGKSVDTSEAVCVKASCVTGEKAACNTRILPKPHLAGNHYHAATERHRNLPGLHSTEHNNNNNNNNKKRPNLLLLMIDPISRARFERSLVKTSRLLQLLDFTSFSQYTAVGNNSGPNQAALYSGRPLASRDSIATHSQKNTTNQWLWDTLRGYGYATFKAEDGCIENSNMIQSIRPQVDHGDALLEMMCYDFQRPNCVGDTPAAQHLLNYGTQFINAYEKRNQSWAALLHFIDSHEDTQTLEGTLDDPLWHFLFSIYESRQCGAFETSEAPFPCTVWDNTMIVMISDHGLHYGGYLLSQKGLKERSQPMLHIHLPKVLSSASHTLKANQNLYATPFDVYETILDALVPEASAKSHDATGSTLLQPLPPDRTSCATTKGVPAFVCDLLQRDDQSTNTIMPLPPSVMSFYADIPRVNKATTPLCNAKGSNATIFTEKDTQCVCATNLRPWYKCSEHPWSAPSQSTRGETFSMVDCIGERSFEINVQRDPKVLKSLPETKKTPTEPRPNILFLEVDSVSFAYADRHLPRTRELLNGFRLRRNDSDPTGFSCNAKESLCAAEFKSFSVVGASSIPNQVAVLGGCIATVGRDRCSQLRTDKLKNRTVCANESHVAYNMELVNTFRSNNRNEPLSGATYCRVDSKKRSPWIFDIAKSAGYVTLFAEEFCFDGSIYVPQGNVFPLSNVDILPHQFFCRATERKVEKESREIVAPMWKYEYTPREGLPQCIDQYGGYERGRVALDHIETMFSSYHEFPKFAYLNAMAAHRYADFDKMANFAEVFDLILSSFLKRMLAKTEMANTVIVLRSDHGLQAGPQIADYSLQVEALRPWTEIIVPKRLAGLSLKRLFDNQYSLATGFDLYRTLTSTLVGEDSSLMSESAPWSHHLWRETVPRDRDCKSAHVSSAYCIFEGQRTLSYPNIGTCNMAEDDQALVCPQYAETFRRDMSAAAASAYYIHEIKAKACPKALSPSILDQWSKIDDVMQQHQEAVDKTAYLHPLQTSMINAFVSLLSDALRTKETRNLHVCQTGFGAGHMASMFLNSSSNVKLHLFDSDALARPFQPSVLDLLEAQYEKKRVIVHKGDSCVTLPQMQGFQCDFLYGSSPSCTTDSLDLVEHAPCGVLLISVATKNIEKDIVSQWSRLYRDGCIKNISCFVERAPMGTGRQDNTDQQKFCIGVTTGKCQNARHGEEASGDTCDTTIAQTTKLFGLHRLARCFQSSINLQNRIERG